MKYDIGDILIAKTSFKDCGYLRGDTIKVVEKSCFEGDFVGKNLTRPYLNDDRVYIGDCFRGKVIRKSSPERVEKEKRLIRFLGIPIFTVEKVGDDE